MSAYTELLAEAMNAAEFDGVSSASVKSNPMENIIDIREYDVPFHVRVSIDKSIFVGTWYQISCK